MAKTLIEVEHLRVLKNLAQAYLDGLGRHGDDHRVHDAVFVAEMQIQGAEHQLEEAA